MIWSVMVPVRILKWPENQLSLPGYLTDIDNSWGDITVKRVLAADVVETGFKSQLGYLATFRDYQIVYPFQATLLINCIIIGEPVGQDCSEN